MSNTTPGYLASAAASADQWVFNLASGLQANTQYFFYMDAPPGVTMGVQGADAYPGGIRYAASGAASNYSALLTNDYNFTLAEATAVPAPTVGGGPISWLIAALGVGGFAGCSQLRRRRDGALQAA